jgi:hypothetical protein
MEYWGIAFLRDFSMHELAKTGDSEKRQLLVEATLESRNEAASGLVADLTTSTQSGSAAGDVDTAEPTAENSVNEGQAIEMITDGGSSTACECVVTFVIRR